MAPAHDRLDGSFVIHSGAQREFSLSGTGGGWMIDLESARSRTEMGSPARQSDSCQTAALTGGLGDKARQQAII